MRKEWRDGWSAPLWAFALFMNLSFAVALWGAFDTRVATIDFLLTLVITLVSAKRTPLLIAIEGNWLYIGRARIEVQYISEIRVLTKLEIGLLRTRDADPNAYLDLRFWVNDGIQIILKDARDYTPYWLISTHSGEAIKTALEK